MISVLDVVEGRCGCTDRVGETLQKYKVLVPMLTVRAGQVVNLDLCHPPSQGMAARAGRKAPSS